MFVSQTILGFLDHAQVDFDLITHARAQTAAAAAHHAHIPIKELAKGVLLHDDADLVLAVVPASRRVNTFAIANLTDSASVQLVQEDELGFVFRDCERGAVPIIGEAFGVHSVIDDALLRAHDVYFEAGDHERLVHMSGHEFARLMSGKLHGRISC